MQNPFTYFLIICVKNIILNTFLIKFYSIFQIHVFWWWIILLYYDRCSLLAGCNARYVLWSLFPGLPFIQWGCFECFWMGFPGRSVVLSIWTPKSPIIRCKSFSRLAKRFSFLKCWSTSLLNDRLHIRPFLSGDLLL